MHRYPILIKRLLLLMIIFSPVTAASPRDRTAVVISNGPSECVVAFNFDELEQSEISLSGRVYQSWVIPGEGMTYEDGRPALPAVSRWVVVPPYAGLELAVASAPPRVAAPVNPPAVVRVDGLGGRDWNGADDQRFYPPVVAEMSRPVIRRGVRMVKVTVYPIQYDIETGEYLRRDDITAEVRFTDDPPDNPVRNPIRRNRSRNFLRYIRQMAVNGDRIGRDDPDYGEPPAYNGHYLVVTHANCLQYAAPFIEWRRKAGYKVDILSLSDNDARNAQTIQNRIRQIFNGYLDRGEDPFEYLLLIGDRQSHFYPPAAQWVLEANVGTTRWGAPHADYLYACLEGDDEHPDVAVSRWPSGSVERMQLAVGRTLAYEAFPDMEEPDWFTRGAQYIQHWGNNPFNAWHPSIPSDARWGEEVLKSKGFEVTFYEDFNYDQMGQAIGPVIRNLMNAGTNVMLGRAENYYFVPGRGGHDFNQEIRANTKFPIEINTNGHGEWSREIMFRTGSGNNLKGYVATSFTWNGPPTAPNSAIWMEMVRNHILLDQPYGWAYSHAIADFELYFPNTNFQGQNIYPLMKTEVNNFADPGIQWWRGVPLVVAADYPGELSVGAKRFPVRVTAEDGEPVAGATVTLYFPGDMPDFNNAAYASYDDMVTYNTTSDADGWANFTFGPEFESVPPGDGFLTVTGRDIKPFFGEVPVRSNLNDIQVVEWALEEVQGNGDEFVNPGEIFDLELTAHYFAADGAVADVTAEVGTSSPWVAVAANEIHFGDIEAGADADGDRSVRLNIHPACPDGAARASTRPVLEVEFRSGDERWLSAVQLDPYAPNYDFRQVVGSPIIPTEMVDLNLELTNSGRMDAPSATANLTTTSGGIGAVRETAVFPAIRAGESARIVGEPFAVAANSLAVPGSPVEMRLILRTETDFLDTTYFTLQAGEPRERTPLGPDGYGYICFDDTDTLWEMAPEYDWIEISLRENDRDYDGISCEFTGRSQENIGESRVVELGFETQFYGRVFDRITIGTNGFIAMGAQPRIVNFQNWPLDRAIGGGVGMIAPLWDDLTLPNNAQVYYFPDEENHRFIVEWYRLRARDGGQRDLMFQVILFDREFWGTATGDQNILFQYRQVENVRGRQEGADREKNSYYASVGISSPDGTTGISYSWMNDYPVQAAPLADRRALLFATSAEYRSCILYGTVFDAATGEPIEGARVITTHGFISPTDEQGFFRIPNALAELTFSLTAAAPGYNDSTIADLEVPEGDSLEVNFGLLHPEFSPTVERLAARLDPDRMIEIPFSLVNTGNGTLNWSVERRLLGDANAEPWEYRRAYNVGEQVNDDRIEAVVFVGDRFYIAAANGGDPVIFVTNRDGDVLDTIPQPADDSRGIRDLAWDGELFWGGIGATVYGFTPDGEVRVTFESGLRPTTCLTFDPRNDVLWVSSTTTDIFAFNRQGERINDLTLNRRDLRMYGFAYWPEDPDGHFLYVLHRDRDSGAEMVHKFNPDSGDTIRVATLNPPAGGTPGGAFITNQFDVYSWVFINISSAGRDEGGDRIDIWQLDARKDWFRLELLMGNERNEAATGIITAGEAADFILTLNSRDLPIVPFEGELRFFHNARGFVHNLPVRLDVIGQVPPDPFNLLYPVDGDTLDSSVVRFAWSRSVDPNFGDDVTYTLWLDSGVDSISFPATDTTLTLNLDTAGFDMVGPMDFTWFVNAHSREDIVASNQIFLFRYLPSDLSEPGNTVPTEFGIIAVYPNPFNSTVKVTYGIDKPGAARLAVYDMTGRLVATLTDGWHPAGIYAAVLTGNTFGIRPSGIYFVRLTTVTESAVRKVVLLR